MEIKYGKIYFILVINSKNYEYYLVLICNEGEFIYGIRKR